MSSHIYIAACHTVAVPAAGDDAAARGVLHDGAGRERRGDAGRHRRPQGAPLWRLAYFLAVLLAVWMLDDP